jgi:limonene-1,2-epoxide hydrolase
VTTPTTDKTAVVIRLLALLDEAAVSAQPADVLATVFDEILADDFVYQNRPQRAAVGKREFTEMESMECAILRIAATDDWVLTERVDSWSIQGVTVSMPIMGSFEVDDAGRVRSWTDYVSYSPQWEASGQMSDRFFADWQDTELEIVKGRPKD